MGIINPTPDSFSDGGQLRDARAAVERALSLVEEGADIIDIGGESSRPGSVTISVEEELARVVPVVAGVRAESEVIVSIDTTKARVASEAIVAGADIVNDISAGRFDDGMLSLVAKTRVGMVLMHLRGVPRTMQREDLDSADIVADVVSHLAQRIEAAVAAGVVPDALCVDPGIGFGKTVRQNLELVLRIEALLGLGHPVLIGASRKSFIGQLTGRPVEARGWGTAAVNAVVALLGAHLVRVHDVAQARDVVAMARAIRDAREGQWSSSTPAC